MNTNTLIRPIAASIVALGLTVAPALAADEAAPAPVTELRPATDEAAPPAKPFDPNATAPEKVEVPPAVVAEPGVGGVIIVEAEAEAIPAEPVPIPMKKVAFIGIGSQPLDADTTAALNLPEGVGLKVVAVMPDTPAAAAGVLVGDVLHKIGDQVLVNCDQFRTLVRIHKPGDEVALTVIRDAKPVELKTKLVERQVPAVEPNNVFQLAPDANLQPIGPGQRLHIGPNGIIEVHPLDGPVDPDQLRMQIEQRMLELRQRIEQQRGGAGQLAPGAGQGHAQASATVGMSDNEHNIKYAITNGDKHLTVSDKAGKVLFDGPVNTDEQKAKIPADVRPKFDKLEKQTQLNIRILPDPFVPAPKEDEKPGDVLG